MVLDQGLSRIKAVKHTSKVALSHENLAWIVRDSYSFNLEDS